MSRSGPSVNAMTPPRQCVPVSRAPIRLRLVGTLCDVLGDVPVRLLLTHLRVAAVEMSIESCGSY